MTIRAGQLERVLWAIDRIRAGTTMTARKIMERYCISYATAKRDLIAIERHAPVQVFEREVPGALPRKELRSMPGAKNATSSARSGLN